MQTLSKREEELTRLTTENIALTKTKSDLERERAIQNERVESLQASDAKNLEELRELGRKLQALQAESQHESERAKSKHDATTKELTDAREHIALLRRDAQAYEQVCGSGGGSSNISLTIIIVSDWRIDDNVDNVFIGN